MIRQVLLLLSPRIMKLRNTLRQPGRDKLRYLSILALTAVLWAVIYVVFVKALAYFTKEEMFGSVAAVKLLSMILITFAFVVIISNVITVFSTFYLSEDLELILSGPVPPKCVFAARFTETLADSSWMVLVFGLPVFAAYGTVFSASFSFYLLSLLGFGAVLVMMTAVGILIVETLVKSFPIRRLRDVFVLAGILIFVGIYLLFRMMRPEDLLNPEGFASAVDYLSIISEPSSPLLPTTWLVELLRPYITGHGYDDRPFYLALLLSAAVGSYRVVGHYHEAVHFTGYSRALESRGARLSKSRIVALLERILHHLLDRSTARIVLKETLLAARDSGRISHLLLLGALVLVYLYNFSVLPKLDVPWADYFFKNLVAFLNIGLAGFVLASLGVRFLFPTVSLEGRAFWILKGAPVSLKKVLWVKFIFYLIPMMLLGLFLVVVTNRLLQLAPFMFAVCTATVALLTVGITSLSIGMGVIHADFKDVDPNRAVTGFGALMTMIYAGLAVAGVILLEAYPVYRVVTAEFWRRPLGPADYLAVCVCFSATVALILYLIVRPLQIGLRRIGDLEI